jgi:phage shock protein PspC (stress-responsive transcriptional regulator)
MTKKTSNLLLIGFFIGFFIIGYIALTKAMPEEKK